VGFDGRIQGTLYRAELCMQTIGAWLSTFCEMLTLLIAQRGESRENSDKEVTKT
jgi:hypothetical protein